MLKGHRPSYRESLMQVRERLAIKCPSSLRTPELEAEIYLHLLETHSSSIEGLAQELQSAAEEPQAAASSEALRLLQQPLLWCGHPISEASPAEVAGMQVKIL